MRGHITKKGARYYFVIDLGLQLARRCESCRKRVWVSGSRDDDRCLNCHHGLGPVHPERKQKWTGGFRTRKEAEAGLTQALTDLQQNTYVEATKQTIREFVGEWLPAVQSTIRPSTWDSYRSNLYSHVVPSLGGVLLRQLTAPQLNKLYRDLLENGRRDGSGGLSPRTVRYVHTILHRVLRDAVRWGKVVRNVADLADPPKQARPEMSVWTGAELRSFLEHVKDERLYALYLLAATTGMRRGELLGLRWEDVDLEGARVQVRQTLVVVDYKPTFSTPKTKRSRRSISLDPVTVAQLRTHRAAQMKERFAWGPAYQETGLVFTKENGSLIHPQSLSGAFDAHRKAAGLPAIRFHDLRHTYATVALSAGTHPKVVADRLGHASIAITLDTYSHVIAGVGEEAANAIATMILSG